MDFVQKYNFNFCWFCYIQKFHVLFRKEICQQENTLGTVAFAFTRFEPLQYIFVCGLSWRMIFFKNNSIDWKALKKSTENKVSFISQTEHWIAMNNVKSSILWDMVTHHWRIGAGNFETESSKIDCPFKMNSLWMACYVWWLSASTFFKYSNTNRSVFKQDFSSPSLTIRKFWNVSYTSDTYFRALKRWPVLNLEIMCYFFNGYTSAGCWKTIWQS